MRDGGCRGTSEILSLVVYTRPSDEKIVNRARDISIAFFSFCLNCLLLSFANKSHLLKVYIILRVVSSLIVGYY